MTLIDIKITGKEHWVESTCVFIQDIMTEEEKKFFCDKYNVDQSKKYWEVDICEKTSPDEDFIREVLNRRVKPYIVKYIDGKYDGFEITEVESVEILTTPPVERREEKSHHD